MLFSFGGLWFLLSTMGSVSVVEANQCISDIPQDNSGNDAVLIEFFSNPEGGPSETPCPVCV